MRGGEGDGRLAPGICSAGCAVIRLHRGRRAQRRSSLASTFRPLRPSPCHRPGAPSLLHSWTSPSSTPSVLPKASMADQSARLFLCARCRVQVLVCRQCDRGQRYCADGCAATTRRALQRDSARRYQRSRAGRFNHALRAQRWRARQRALANIVTHQGSPERPSDAVLADTQTSALAIEPCSTTRSIATTVAIIAGPWHCHWCCAPCAALVRQGFVRHSHGRSLRHGHSP